MKRNELVQKLQTISDNLSGDLTQLENHQLWYKIATANAYLLMLIETLGSVDVSTPAKFFAPFDQLTYVETWEESDTQKFEPISMPFKINDCVLTTNVLTADNAYMIPGSRAQLEGVYMVMQNHIGIIDLICEGDSTYKVNFGASGIWYVRPELLKPMEQTS